MDYLKALEIIHNELRPSNYVEIGCRNGKSLGLSKCQSIAIDPDFEIKFPVEAPTRFFKTTSDQFFQNYDVKKLLNAPVDLAFIDGMHNVEYVLRDFINLEKNCRPDAVILIDDVLPEKIEWTTRERLTQAWTGDVYQIIAILRRYRPDLHICVLDINMKGMALIRCVNPNSTTLADNYDDIEKAIFSGEYKIDSAEAIRGAMHPVPTSELDVFLADANKIRASTEDVALQCYPAVNPMIIAEKILCPQLLQLTDWKHEDRSLARLHNSRYYNIWKNFADGHKKYSYFELYDQLFAEFSGKQPKVLEIGVYKGASIQTWKQFFGEDSTIVGIDINPDCAKFDAITQGVHVRIGSQSDAQFLKNLSHEFGTFDIIIDDGSHLTHQVIESFNVAFLHCLAEGGIYFIEDLNTSYWADYRTSKYSAMDMVLSLSEMTHQFYFENRYKDYAINNYKDSYSVPLISSLVNEVRIFDSAAAIYKKSHFPPLVFHT